MSEPIGPGDVVECVDAAPRSWNRMMATPLVVGAIYTVREVSADGRGLTLAEVAPWPGFEDFYADRFRPIYRPKGKQLIRDLLQPVKEGAGVTPVQHATVMVSGDERKQAWSGESRVISKNP